MTVLSVVGGLNESAGSLVGWTHGDLQCPIKDFDLILKKVGEKENKNVTDRDLGLLMAGVV